MSCREYLKTTNTGVLIADALRGRLHFPELPGGRDAFLRALDYPAVLLFPAEDAMPASAMLAMQRDDHAAAAMPRSVVILDGTWPQARKLRTFVPDDVRCVAVDVAAPSSFNDIRRQTREDRVCTLEAAAMYLEQAHGIDGVLTAVRDVLAAKTVAHRRAGRR